MIKLLRTIVPAVFAMVMMTGSASAVTSVVAGGSYDITSDTLFTGQVNSMGGSGSYSVNFTSPANPVFSTANAAITVGILGTFTNLTVAWYDAATNSLLNSTPILAGITTLNTIFQSNHDRLGQDLVFSWDNSSASTNNGPISFVFDVAPVPLPAGGLLLITALGGLALVRRRKAVA